MCMKQSDASSSQIVSLAAIFVMSRNAPPQQTREECCMTRQKMLQGRLAVELHVYILH